MLGCNSLLYIDYYISVSRFVFVCQVLISVKCKIVPTWSTIQMQGPIKPTPQRQNLHTHGFKVCSGETWCFRRARRGAGQVQSEIPHPPQAGNDSVVPNCELVTSAAHLPSTSDPHWKSPVWPSPAGTWTQISHLPPPAPFPLNLQSNPGRLHSFLLREVRLYCMCSLLIEILDIISPENLEILQLNGKNTLDHRSQADGDTLHASNINKILILR